MAPDEPSTSAVRIGVLALQGSFREHMTLLQKIPGVEVVEVRTKEELESVAGLIIPGGESTTMALVADRWGLIPELRGFAGAGKPIWGTCAGMIFLAERAAGNGCACMHGYLVHDDRDGGKSATGFQKYMIQPQSTADVLTGQKKGGQALLGGLDINVSRNFFGAQINSFETQLPTPECVKQQGSGDDFRAVFIRAPAVLDAGPNVEVLAEYSLSPEEKQQQGMDKVAVAVRSGVLLATAFHPELTTDLRWHKMFVNMVRQHASQPVKDTLPAPAPLGRAPNDPGALPVYSKEFLKVEAL